MKGFDVIACPWNRPEVTEKQVEMLYGLQQNATPEMKSHYLGMMQTVWSSADQFLEEYNSKEVPGDRSQAACFKAMLTGLKNLEGSQK
jgi:hypothetical protein